MIELFKMFVAPCLVLMGAAFASLVVIFFIISSIAAPFEMYSCKAQYRDYNPKWGFWSGCRIEWEGKMTPVDMVKNINIKEK